MTASSSGNSPSSYTSVRALDKFGNSVQLKHAREAAQKHGRLVIAASNAKNDAVVVVSLGNRPVVHSITLPTLESDHHPDDDRHFLAMCCTGVKGDANWLIYQVQQHVAQIWERYNYHPRGPSIAHFVARLLGSFGGEDINKEWQPSIRREKIEWARPFGVQTMILSTQHPCILLVEPSGRVMATTTKKKGEGTFWCAMGKESGLVQERFGRTELEDEGTVSNLQEKLVQQLLETASTTRNSITEVMVEVLTVVGIERMLLQYKNGEQISSSKVQL